MGLLLNLQSSSVSCAGALITAALREAQQRSIGSRAKGLERRELPREPPGQRLALGDRGGILLCVVESLAVQRRRSPAEMAGYVVLAILAFEWCISVYQAAVGDLAGRSAWDDTPVWAVALGAALVLSVFASVAGARIAAWRGAVPPKRWRLGAWASAVFWVVSAVDIFIGGDAWDRTLWAPEAVVLAILYVLLAGVPSTANSHVRR
jgi:hypothetical protein